MAIDDGRYLCCPLCQGKGQMHRSELIERLGDPQNREQLQVLLRKLKEEEEKSLVLTPNDQDRRDAFQREVYSWPPKRILWRRSPKE